MEKLNIEVRADSRIMLDELLSWQVSNANFASALRKYRLFSSEKMLSGDKTPEDDFKDLLKEKGLSLDEVVYFGVYAYIHGDIVLNLEGFSCPWDSGFAGYIYFTKEDLRKFYGVKRITKKVKEQVEEAIKIAIDNFNKGLAEYVVYVDEMDEAIGWYFEEEPSEEEVKNFLLENFNIDIQNKELNISYLY